MTESTETIICPQWVIPVQPPGLILNEHAVVIGDGKIVAVMDTTTAKQRYPAAVTIKLPGQALIPGFVNTHTHTAMTLLRGYADDIPLQDWLHQYIWPAEQHWVDESFVATGGDLAMAEMIRNGTTCFSDMYFYPEQTAARAMRAGIRAVIGLIVLDFPTPWAATTDEYFEKGLAVYEQYRQQPLVRCTLAPHAPYSVADIPLQRVAARSQEWQIPVHIHLHETADEILESKKKYGVRPLQRVQRLGLLTDRLIAVHMTQLQPEEIEAIAEHGASVVHCPESNLKLASGYCPVQQLIDTNINVALGTDGAASNNDLDMLAEARCASLLSKGFTGDSGSMSAPQTLAMATINGARALGMAEVTGSIEVGKWADLAAIDLSAVETQPCYDPIGQIIYSASRGQVSNVWVAGRQLLRAREITTIDMAELDVQTRCWFDKLAEYRKHSCC